MHTLQWRFNIFCTNRVFRRRQIWQILMPIFGLTKNRSWSRLIFLKKKWCEKRGSHENRSWTRWMFQKMIWNMGLSWNRSWSWLISKCRKSFYQQCQLYSLVVQVPEKCMVINHLKRYTTLCWQMYVSATRERNAFWSRQTMNGMFIRLFQVAWFPSSKNIYFFMTSKSVQWKGAENWENFRTKWFWHHTMRLFFHRHFRTYESQPFSGFRDEKRQQKSLNLAFLWIFETFCKHIWNYCTSRPVWTRWRAKWILLTCE